MKKQSWQAGAVCALALSLAVAACGGYTTVSLGGQVVGLTVDGLVLANGDDTVAVPANASTYNFPAQIDAHGSFNVTVKTQPPRLTCIVLNPTGAATGVAITYANVVCSPNTYALGGTVSGLTTDGLVLTNGSNQAAIAANATSFVFPTRVADGSVYGVAVLTQPAGKTCTVANGTGTMGAADVTNIQVTCQ